MKFARLRLSGFKSFADPTEIEIADGLTGIVGPNGCGKSNLVEALRWVMGESSARGLRGVEMEDVVFTGSASRSPFDFAEVALTLEGPVADLAGEGEQIELVRRIGRGAGSSFRLRGREVRARDVQILFADAASGARSAAIVGQGQIARLVDARPDERRRLLEEAAGIGGLHTRRREAELRLQATERNLERLVDRLQELEARRVQIRRQAREAERFRKLQGELRTTERLRLLVRWRGAETRVSRATGQLTAREQELELASQKLAELRHQRQQDATRLRDAESRQAEGARQLARLEERLAANRRAREQLREARAAAENRLAELARELAREREAAAEAAAAIGQRREEAARAAEQETEQAARLADLEREQDVHRARAAELDSLLHLRTGELERARAACEAAAGRVTLLEAELSRVDSAIARSSEDGAGPFEILARHVEELETQRNHVSASIAAIERERADCRAAREAAEQALVEAEASLAAAIDERRIAEARLRACADARAAIGDKLALLERHLADLDARRGRLAAEVEALAADAPGQQLRAAAARLDALETSLAAARRTRQAAEAEALRLEQECAAMREAIRASEDSRTRLESEIAALEMLLPPTPADAVLHRLQLPPEHAEAVAAVLGDELLVGTDPVADSYWREELAGRDLPPDEAALPAPARPLAVGLDLPPALRRRLGAVGLVEPAQAARAQLELKPGQCLVSPQGGLWRWDGLVRSPGASAEAARRLRIERDLRDRRAELDNCIRLLVGLAAEQAVLDAAAREAAAALGAAAAEAGRLEEQIRGLRGEIAALERERASEQSRAARLAGELGRLDADRAALEIERRELVTRLDGGEDEAVLRAALEAATGRERRARERREECARARDGEGARLDQLDRAMAAARRELDDLDRRLTEAREELARRRSEAALRAAERERLLSERDRLLPLLRAACSERESAQEQLAAAQAAQADVEAACQRARETLEGLGAAHSRVMQQAAEARAARDRIRAELVHLERECARARARLEELERAVAEAQTAREAVAAGDDRAEQELLVELEQARRAHAEAEEAVSDCAARLAASEAGLAACEQGIAGLRERIAGLRAERAQAERECAGIEAEIVERAGRSPAELLAAGGEALQEELRAARVDELEARIERLRTARDRIGAVNLRAAHELAEIEAELENARHEESEIRAALERLRRGIARLDREGRERLVAAFGEVDRHFGALFGRLFGGGRAALRLTDLDDPFAAGLELDAMPPGKRLQHVSLLSGGEKSLAGLALVFAFFLARPSPLCVLDEVDAALDDANVERFVDVMEEIAHTTGTRFLVVTHHPLTMARMDRLYGVTMMERGTSRLVSVALDEAVELRATA